MHKTYFIKRRSGRHVTELYVQLPKPPKEYKMGEQLTVCIEERNVPCHVIVDVDKYNSVMHVA
jgi:hypothetical protein